MSRSRHVLAAVALCCAGLVLGGCTSDDGGDTGQAASTEAVPTVVEESSASPEVEESFDVTVVPASEAPSATAAPAPAASATASVSATAPAAASTSSGDAASPSAAASAASPTTSPGATPTAAVRPGRVYVFVTSVDLATRTITYDEAQFLTGDAANKAAAEDKQEVPVPNDYYIRNVNRRLRNAAVAPNAVLLGNIAMTQQQVPTAVTLEQLAQFVASTPSPVVGFWLTIDASRQITNLEEQFVP